MRVLSARNDAAEWDALLARLPDMVQDVHFTSAYGRVQETAGGEAFCAVETFANGEFVMQPFMRYRIVGTNFFEITNPYGFGGPIDNVVLAAHVPHLGRVFAEGLRAWARQMGVVSEYCRPHPLYAHYQLPLLRDENIVFFKNTVCIDNLQGLTEMAVAHRVRKSIKKARPDYLVLQLNGAGAPLMFKPLYDASMDRLAADDKWRHRAAYWDAHNVNNVGARWYFLCDMLGERRRALLTVGIGKVAYAHFLGNDGERVKGGDELLYFDAARDLAQRGFERLHLGGGLSEDANDSLLFFKSGFSDALYSVGYYRRIFQPDIYDEIQGLKAEALT